MLQDVGYFLGRLEQATQRLLATTHGLTDIQAREPSLLPGWSRGHVLTHIARNANGMVNLLRWARAGTPIPMYASAEFRDADIEAGARRPVARLAADVEKSAEAFATEAANLPDRSWTVLVSTLRGSAFPAFGVLTRRLLEVEIHHVDLAAGYEPADWPDEFVADALPRVADSFSDCDEAPYCLVWAEGSAHGYHIGRSEVGSQPTIIYGPPADLLAWLLGRQRPATLRVSGDWASLPVLPPWRHLSVTTSTRC